MSKPKCGGKSTANDLICLDEFFEWYDEECPLLGMNNSRKWGLIWDAIIKFHDNRIVRHPDFLEVLIDRRLFPLDGILYGMKFTPVDELLVDTHGTEYTTIYRIHRRKDNRALLHDERTPDKTSLVDQDCPRKDTPDDWNTLQAILHYSH